MTAGKAGTRTASGAMDRMGGAVLMPVQVSVLGNSMGALLYPPKFTEAPAGRKVGGPTDCEAVCPGCAGNDIMRLPAGLLKHHGPHISSKKAVCVVLWKADRHFTCNGIVRKG